MDHPALVIQLRRSRQAPEELYRFDRSPVHIGRGPRNELLIDHAFVSHLHGVLHFDGSGVDFIDLGSTNGSFLEGVRVESPRFTNVHAGAELAIGITRLRVELDVRGRRRSAEHAALPADEASLPRPAHASFEGSAHAPSFAAVIELFATSFLALSREQRAWRERIGLAQPRSGLHALEDPTALLGYLLSPGHEASRVQELDVACEELLRNERALVRALAEDPLPLGEP